MDFANHPPSTTWETIAFPDAPGCHFWAWFKPPEAPQGLAMRIPDGMYHRHAPPQAVTLRRLLHAAGVNAAAVAAWKLYGTTSYAMQGMNPALDYPIPPPASGVDPTIVVQMVAAQSPAAATPPASLSSRQAAYDRIEADWNSSLLLEKQVTVARKKLAATLVRINSLNRDLTPDEWQNADNRDNADWQDARRWLRDVASRLSRYMKDYDVGVTSAAGQRNLFEATYRQYIALRRPVEGIDQIQRDFETYRKNLQTLMNNMHRAQASAERDGQQRAQAVLNRIAGKARVNRARRG